MLDVVVIGAGPAGVQAAYFLKQKGFTFEVLERNDCAGSFFKTFPRHKTLISINKRYTGSDNREFNLRHDWNSLLSENAPLFKEFDEKLFPSSDSLLEYMASFIESEELDITYNADVKEISKNDGVFNVELTSGRNIQAKTVIVATGYTKPNIPDIKGIEHADEYSFCSVDKNDFINKKVLIIGKGNSAFETADNLVETAAVIHLSSPNSLKLAWSSHYVGNLRAVNNNILDMYQLKSQHAIMDADIEEIVKTENGFEVTFNYKHAEGEVETLKYDYVLSCAGFKFGADIFAENCMPELAYMGKFPKMNNGFESSNVEGLYFAGALMHMLDYKKATSGFIHGFRYNVKSLIEILENRILGKNIPHKLVENDDEILGKYIIDRVNVVSSLWQQPGFLAEFFRLGKGDVEHHEAMPLEYGTQDYFANDDVLALTFEYGQNHDGDIFSQNRIARDNLNNAEQSQFLHPVLRHFKNGKLMSEFHVIEDLEAHWTYAEHLVHITDYLNKELEFNFSPA